MTLQSLPGFPQDLKQLKPVFDAVDAAMMILDVDETGEGLSYGSLNTAAENYFGIRHEDYQNKKILPYRGSDRERRDRRQQTIDAYLECVRDRKTVVLEQSHVLPSGETRWGRHTIAPILNNGIIGQLLVTSIDVTELITARRELEDALTRTLGEFMAICATCKSIRSEGDWLSIERYAATKMNFYFSHGLCPSCLERALGEI